MRPKDKSFLFSLSWASVWENGWENREKQRIWSFKIYRFCIQGSIDQHEQNFFKDYFQKPMKCYYVFKFFKQSLQMSTISLNPVAKCLEDVFPYPHSSLKLLFLPTPTPQSLTCQHGVPAKFLALEERGKRPYHNVLIMRRQKQQTSWIVLIKYVWDLETQQLCVQVIQMHFNQLVSSVTFSDTPLRIFLNEILYINSRTVWRAKKENLTTRVFQ